MTKRITVILLILAMLLSVVPVIVGAEEDYVYQIGDDIWVKGSSDDEPTAPTVENGMWVKVIGVDGKHETQPSCGLEIHEDHEPSCYNSSLDVICGKPIHTAKRHNSICSKLKPNYHWVVEVDPSYVPPEVTPPEGGDNEGGEGLESDGTGANDPLGHINFAVTNLDPEGNPIVGSKFGLLAWDGESYAYLQDQAAKEELQQKIEQQNLEQQEKIKELQEAGDVEALNAYLEQANLQNEEAVTALNESDNTLLAKTTGADGKAHFHAVEKYLSEIQQSTEGGNASWSLRLVQSEVDDDYQTNNQTVQVIIEQTGEGAYELSIDGVKYTEDCGSFVFENEIQEYKLFVLVEFFDTEGNKIAGEALNDVTASLNVVCKKDENSENSQKISVNFPSEEAIVEAQKWKQTMLVSPGTYTAEDLQIQGTIQNHTFDHSEMKFVLPEGAVAVDASDEHVTLGKLTGATLSIKAYYKKAEDAVPGPSPEQPQEPEKPVEYTIIVESVDDSGKGITGADYSLVSAAGIAKAESGNQWIYTIDTADCVPGDYILEETVTPQGFKRCTDKYTVSVKEDGDVILSKGGVIQRLFTRKNLAETGGTETVTFRHSRKTATISITSLAAATADNLCWNIEDTEAEFEKKEQVFILKWKNAQGAWQQEELSVGSEPKTFKTALPYETEYEVVPKDTTWYSYYTIVGNKGTVSVADTANNISMTAVINYTIVHGDDLDLYFTKVDSQTKEGLAGAKFTLTNSDGQELQRYTTKKGGAVDVEDIIDRPGKYLLKETKAPEEYDVLRKPVEINVFVAYRTATKGGETVIEQYLYEDVVHKSVVMGKDGTYWIKNTASGDNPKTGDDFDFPLWVGMLVVSISLLSVITLEGQKKKHSGR